MSQTITKYLGNLKGIEIGRGAQNNYHLNAITVDSPYHDEWNNEQLRYGGSISPIDIIAEANLIPLEGNSQHYVFTSHVLEHLADPISAIKEWYRIIKDQGYIAMVIPNRNALTDDRGKPLTTLREICQMHAAPVTLTTTSAHLTRWTPVTVIDLIQYGIENGYWNLDLVCVENPDDQIQNGFTVILQVIK